MARIFGTDGVRGLANRDLTAELALDLSVAAAHVLGEAGAFADQRPTAVVAQSDLLASGVVLGARELGLRVPEDVSVAGFDGLDLPWLAPDVLTTVVQPIACRTSSESGTTEREASAAGPFMGRTCRVGSASFG